ncbi:MAG: Flp family type IVb pilin [Pseudomonadota bacterium]
MICSIPETPDSFPVYPLYFKLLGSLKPLFLKLSQEKKHAESNQTFFYENAGATAIEYALIASLISVMIIAAAALLGGKLQVIYDDVASRM